MTPLVVARARARSDGRWQGTRRASCPPRCPSSRSHKAPRTTGSCAAGWRRGSKAAPRARSTSASPRDGGERAVCLAPAGLEDGARVQLARDFTLVTNRPVSFRLYSSSSRQDEPGALVPVGDGRAETIDDGSDLLELPPIVTVLRARGRSEVTVRLAVHVTELGALEILCVTPAKRTSTWKLAFDMRSGGAAAAASEGRAASEDRRGKSRSSRRRSRPAPRCRRWCVISKPCSKRAATSGR